MFKSILERDWRLIPDFITVAQESKLIAELESKLKLFRWNLDHFDDAIQNYREFIISNPGDFPALTQITKTKIEPLLHSFTHNPLLPTHVLQLGVNGRILPHIDNLDYSGRLIAGLSLNSDCTMVFTCKDSHEQLSRIQIPQRSLYVQKDSLRYQYKHSIESVIQERISVVFRDKKM